MRKLYFRDVLFVDRENEEKFVVDRLNNDNPEKLLFIYGPKSSGKTNFIERIAEEVLDKDKFFISYVNFRSYALINYTSFLNIYFQELEEGKPWVAKAMDKLPIKINNVKGSLSIPYDGFRFGLDVDFYNKMQENKVDSFDVLREGILYYKSKGKMPILIIDEVQELKDIYMNGDIKKRYLLSEFFKFLVRLTKETHLAHIIILTSSSTFIDEIYNNSNLAQTSEFYLFDHLSYDVTKEWLKDEGFSDDEIEVAWEYLGGCPFNIHSLISAKNVMPWYEFHTYLKELAMEWRTRISFTISREFSSIEEKNYFKKVLKNILKYGSYIKDDSNELEKKVIDIGVDKNLLFIKATTNKVIFNAPIMKKGAEIYFQDLIEREKLYKD